MKVRGPGTTVEAGVASAIIEVGACMQSFRVVLLAAFNRSDYRGLGMLVAH